MIITEHFTNLVTNPSFKLGMDGWEAVNPAYPVTWSAADGGSISMTSQPQSDHPGVRYVGPDGNGIPVVGGAEYSMSLVVHSDSGNSYFTGFHAQLVWAGDGRSRTDFADIINSAREYSTKVAERIVAPYWATRVSIHVDPVANKWEIVPVLVVESLTFTEGYLLEVFDGDSENAVWNGTPHASTSTLAVEVDTNVYNLTPNPAFETGMNWEAVEGASISLSPTGGIIGDACMAVQIEDTWAEIKCLDMTPVDGDTLSMGFHVNNMPGGSYIYGLIDAYDADGEEVNGFYVYEDYIYAEEWSWVLGTDLARLAEEDDTITHVSMTIYFDLISVPTEPILFDGFMLGKGRNLTEYFDGDSENAEWLGTPHASVSMLDAPAPPDPLPPLNSPVRIRWDDFTHGVNAWYETNGAVGAAGGDTPGNITTIDGREGRPTRYAYIGDGGHNANDYLSTTVTIGEGGGVVEFWAKSVSESGYDYCEFYIDDEEIHWRSGINPWERFEYALEEGTHELKWSYESDQSYSDGFGGTRLTALTITNVDMPQREYFSWGIPI